MIRFFKRRGCEEREKMSKAITALTVAANGLNDRIDDMGEFGVGANEEMITLLKEIKAELELARHANEAVSRYFKFEADMMKKAQEETLTPPGRHDDLF
uniref:Uncharacterized protein n=1 Tax=viral metagenome TaxID=1070528 RepID=A0A6M3IZL1_9ZZZZ